MRIWVDADACPNVIKDILVRAAERTHIAMTLVAGQPVPTPRSRWVTAVTVATGFDAADDAITASTPDTPPKRRTVLPVAVRLMFSPRAVSLRRA